jgi:hypothetical protein
MKKPLLDDDKRSEIITVLALGGTFALAAHHVGCSRATIFRAAKLEPEFRKQLTEAMASTEIQFLKTIKRAGSENKCWQAAKWALEHMHPDRYARKAFTMPLADVKDLVSQVLDAIAQEITDYKTRVAVRRRIRRLVDGAIRKAKERARER